MKKLLALLLCVLLVLSLAACGQKTDPTPAPSSDTAEAKYTPGTYKGTGSGFGGTLEVEVTVSETAIEDIKIVSDSETAGRAETDDAKELVIDDIITKGTTDVDSVTGATMTSDALKEAVAMALALAEGKEVEPAPSGEAEPEAGLFTAGTYEEVVSGRNSKMTVEVVLSEDKIEAVNVKDHQETATVASVALERVPAAIVENQTTNVDTVTGATVTSNAIIYAVKQAVKEAGGDQAALDAIDAKAKPQDTIEKTADVIVVGGGGAGMAAALAAADGGATVILIEKTSMLGGNTVVCGGAMNAADTEWAAQFDSVAGETATLEQYAAVDVATLPEEYQADFLTLKAQIEEYLAGDTTKHFDSVELHTFQTMYHGLRTDLNGETIYGNYDLVTTLTKNAMDAIAWLGEKGIQWDNSKVTQPTGAMWRRGHNTSMIKGTEYVVALEPVIKQGGEIMYETAGKELIIEDGRVVGVKAVQADGTEVILHANKAVVLACGGFGNNTAMCQEYNTYWAEIPDDMKTTNASGQTGDGITMGLQAGAALTGMNFIQLMHVSDPVSGDLFTGLIPQQSANYIMFNQEGKRFVAETAPRDTIAQAAIDNGGLFFLIADIDIAEEARWLSDWEVEVENGRAYKADTLEELGKLMGYDDATIAVFVEEVEKFNSYVDNANDPDFNRTAFDQKIDNGPFFATPRKPAIHHTMGGLVIDTDAHVLDENGNIIPGLYAAGEVTGGIHGGNRLGGNAVADVMVFGRIAGTNAAAEGNE